MLIDYLYQRCTDETVDLCEIAARDLVMKPRDVTRVERMVEASRERPGELWDGGDRIKRYRVTDRASEIFVVAVRLSRHTRLHAVEISIARISMFKVHYYSE